jgi:type II secretory pathway component GspD/PulD (secretin)
MGFFSTEVRGQTTDTEPTPSAQQTSADHQSQPLCHCLGEGSSESVERINKALGSPLPEAGLEFNDMPLEDVVQALQDEYEIPILLDTPALEDVGLNPDKPVTVNVHNTTLRSALRLMLKQLQLTYIIRDEMLIITTPDEADSELITCVYDVRHLSGGTDAKTLRQLVDVILSTIAKSTWAAHGGGEAEIRILPPGVLVISQTQAVHDQIRQFLRVLRAIDSAPPAAAE